MPIVGRYAIGLIVALTVTLTLLVTMQRLISTGKAALTEDQTFSMMDFVRIKKEQNLQTKEDKPEKPETPVEPPPQVMENLDTVDDVDVTDFGAIDFDLSSKVSLDAGFGLGSGDGEYLPIVKVAPDYPRKALSRGIEGWVIVEYTVTKNGSIRDPVVVDAKPKNIFNRSAIKAALKFKYKPRVIDGQPIEVPGVQNIFKFVLDD